MADRFLALLTSLASLAFPALFALAAATTTSSCSTEQVKETTRPTEGNVPQAADLYAAAIEKYSAGDTEYSGFYNAFEYKATLLNAPIRDVLLEKQANYYQWDQSKLMTERQKSLQELSSQTDIFVSFYTPTRQNDNLADSKTIWKVYLDAGGRRYEGKARKSKALFTELIALYPYHTRWNTPYTLTFPVPTTAIEAQESKLTITGPLGTREVQFPAVH